jgi:uncharacterized membrane protein YhaH (DUF805 family)
MVNFITDCFTKKYAVFEGRARRKEFWYVQLFYISTTSLLAYVGGDLYWAFIIVSTIPIISLYVRRLHDIDKSGWWYWLVIIPLLGILILIFFAVQKGTVGANRFGPDPLGDS